MQIHVADCVIDTDRRQVFRSDREVTLSPKAYHLLTLLVAARPRALSKEALQQALWPNTFVVEANLANLVGEIRTALGDSARQSRFIRTVHGFGYAFSAAASEAAEVPAPRVACWLVWEGQPLPLKPGVNIVGRGDEADVRLDVSSVSRRHARIAVTSESVIAEDLASKNGTFVRDARIWSPQALSSGDEVRFGTVRTVFHELVPSATTLTVPVRTEE